MKIHPKCKIKKNENVHHTTVDNDIIIMSPDDNSYYRLNAVGAKIWHMLESGEHHLERIAENIQVFYNITKEQAIHDTTVFIETMITKKIFCESGEI